MDSNPISMLERPQTVRRGTLRKYTSPTRTVGAGKCFSPAAGVEKLCRIFQIDTTSFLTGCTQMTARGRDFQGVVGSAGNLLLVFAAFHKSVFSTALLGLCERPPLTVEPPHHMRAVAQRPPPVQMFVNRHPTAGQRAA